VIIALGPGNHHEASNGSSAKHVQHGNSGNGHHKHKGTPNPHAGGSSSGSTS
jgi:hypothetical protein